MWKKERKNGKIVNDLQKANKIIANMQNQHNAEIKNITNNECKNKVKYLGCYTFYKNKKNKKKR